MDTRFFRNAFFAACISGAAAIGAHAAEEPHAFPNPFVAKNSTLGTIAFTPLPASGTITIYTIDGLEVRTINFNDGIVTWDTKNTNGKNVSSGVYYFLVKGDNRETLGKLVIIR